MGITLENVSYVYEQGTAMQTAALQGISLEIPDNQFIGLIGHTGSGKSTLVQKSPSRECGTGLPISGASAF